MRIRQDVLDVLEESLHGTVWERVSSEVIQLTHDSANDFLYSFISSHYKQLSMNSPYIGTHIRGDFGEYQGEIVYNKLSDCVFLVRKNPGYQWSAVPWEVSSKWFQKMGCLIDG
jgi:hypothetical protein